MPDDQPAVDDTTALRAESGGFAMLALDQRESLRRMMQPDDGAVADSALRRFKSAAMRILSPYASAVLLDRLYAVGHERPAELADGCALILAADVLDQPPGLAVVATSLDPVVTPELIAQVGAAAVKLLVVWRPDGREREREALVREFAALARGAGVPSLVEGIVRPADGQRWGPGERHQAIVRAAVELSSYGGSIYKAEVPGYLPGDLSRVREESHRLTESIGIPWVLLSNGTAPEDFAGAVRQACLGGASGFLAGRAIWADTVSERDLEAVLARRSVERIRRLGRLVAETAGS
ncbi:MAG TPA: hypothetical protein VHY31_26480 [Streptosporangiaceae bacterium]|jgi:sulfofructosephosphate aldolase|nr:hypothetical protein [Streptosporangiaceae bacterium]